MRLSQRRQESLADPTVGLSLHAMKEAYEANFTEASEIEPPKYFTISALPAASDSLIYPGETFDHREVAGKGDTAQEAMDDWKSRLDKCPPVR